MRLTIDCPQLLLTASQRSALERVDDQLDSMLGQPGPYDRTAAAVRSAPEWAIVRELARSALQALGR